MKTTHTPELTFDQLEQQRKNIDAVMDHYAHGAPDDQDNPAAWAAVHAHNERVRLLREQGVRFRTEILYDHKGCTAVRRIAAFDTCHGRLKLIEKFYCHDGGTREGTEVTEAEALRFRNRDGKIMAGW